MIQHSVYEWVRLQSVSMQPQHTSWKLAFACVRARVYVPVSQDREIQKERREIIDKGVSRKMEVSAGPLNGT